MPSKRAFGAYLPGHSLVHRTNAQVKVVLACAFSIGAFFVETWTGLFLLLGVVLALYAIAHLSIGRALRGVLPIAFILVFTILAHACTFDVSASTSGAVSQPGSIGSAAACPLVGSFGVTLDGLFIGVFLALRISLLVFACALLTFTTSEVELVDAMRALFSPLGALHVPVEDCALIVSMALRFVPMTIREAYAVRRAQMARGADFEAGNVLSRIRAWTPVFVPLFVRLFKRADELAMAMDSRCYGLETRTSAWPGVPVRGVDACALVIGLAVLIVVCVFL